VNTKVEEITTGSMKIDSKNQILKKFSGKNNLEAGKIKDFATDLTSISLKLEELLTQFQIQK